MVVCRFGEVNGFILFLQYLLSYNSSSNPITPMPPNHRTQTYTPTTLPLLLILLLTITQTSPKQVTLQKTIYTPNLQKQQAQQSNSNGLGQQQEDPGDEEVVAVEETGDTEANQEETIAEEEDQEEQEPEQALQIIDILDNIQAMEDEIDIGQDQDSQEEIDQNIADDGDIEDQTSDDTSNDTPQVIVIDRDELPQGQIYFKKQPPRTATMSQLRAYMVYLTNLLRKKYKARKLVISPFLNKIAQAHSLDMLKRNFFDHRNPDAENVGERANRYQYFGRIGENLALAYSLDQAQNGFINSPGHFKNAINKIWDEIGVGIAFKGAAYLVTVLFIPRDISRNQLTIQQLQTYQNKLVSVILQQNPNLRGVDKKLSSLILKWLQSRRKTKLLDFVMRQGGYNSNMMSLMYQCDFSRKFIYDIKKSGYFGNKDTQPYTKIGLGIFQRDIRLEIFVLYL